MSKIFKISAPNTVIKQVGNTIDFPTETYPYQVSPSFYARYLVSRREGCVQQRTAYYYEGKTWNETTQLTTDNQINIEGQAYIKNGATPITWILVGSGSTAQDSAFSALVNGFTGYTASQALVINNLANTPGQFNIVSGYLQDQGVTILATFETENGGQVIVGSDIYNYAQGIRNLLNC